MGALSIMGDWMGPALRIGFFIFLWMLLSAPLGAREISIPTDLGCKAAIRQSERYGLWEKTLILRLGEVRRVLSTNAGFIDARAAFNHSAHPRLWKEVSEKLGTHHEDGGLVYLRRVSEELAGLLGLNTPEIVGLGTAADMDNLAVASKEYHPFLVTALVTAGARSNAMRAGVDQGPYIEGNMGPGTVNIIILTNARLTDGAMARAIITATEAKTAAFQDLDVKSSYTREVQATGTGTDGILVVSATKGPKVTYTGGHSKVGELIGKAVYEGVFVGLQRQNKFIPKRSMGRIQD